ncbi:hypothetical protein QWA68_016710 [Fusarium oxysporum]|nr:hypothetical protein QWA68_016710 [Fusarium oxysporum]
MIQDIQSTVAAHGTDRSAVVQSLLTGFREEDIQMTAADLEGTAVHASPSMEVHFGASASFLEAGKVLVARFTLNKRQVIAFLILCRQLDLIHHREKREKSNISQLCQFIGGEGGTGKSRVIKALVELFVSKGISNRLLITATSGTAAARINGITIHSACRFSKDQAAGANLAKDLDGMQLPKQAERFVHRQSQIDWQDKAMLVIDEDEDNSFKAEQRHEHDKAHALWKKFTTVIMLDEQVRAAGDPVLQRLLKRIRLGVQDRTDLELLNSRCYREDRRIPWETGITVVTPLNRNRWNLNMEATLAFQILQQSIMRIFISEHK